MYSATCNTAILDYGSLVLCTVLHAILDYRSIVLCTVLHVILQYQYSTLLVNW